MHVTNRPTAGLASNDTRSGAMQAAMEHDLEVVLKPLSRPELGEIRISDGVFAIGRNEQPFASYDPDILAMLSRRHARIFCERDAVYLADLESRNGTTVNRAALEQTPSRLSDGDEICFGGVLSYRVQITSRGAAARPKGVVLTLTPAADGSGLEPIVVARFPFLVSKTDATFGRYRAAYPKQLEFLSRRQAHIFLKGGTPHIEDLASTNGTFLDGERLQERAVPLHDGMLLAFGGEHFVYRVGVDKGGAFDADATHGGVPSGTGAAIDAKPQVNAGKTTFVAAPDSFLDIFCAETQMAPSEAEGAAPAAAAAATPEPAKARPRGRLAALVAELATVVAGGERQRVRRTVWTTLALLATVGAVGFGLSWWVRSERALKDMIERGEYARAAVKADEALQRDPDDVELKALSTEAALKAKVPEWLGKLAARDFDGARAVVGELNAFGRRNPELLPLAAELEWLGGLEQLIIGRGPDTPIRVYADEDKIAAVIERWNRDTRDHQRALGRVASYVPQFSTPYAEALTRLRKLQSEATVYLGAIERLKSSIAAEMARDRPENLQAVLKEYADKYPGLGGLDVVRQDLARYIDLKREARTRTRLLSLMLKANFATPPFRDSVQAMTSSGQLPPAALVRQYAATTQAWKEGQLTPALAGLRSMVSGPWAEAAASELQRKQAVVERFAALQGTRSAPDYPDRLIAFRESLDADEDVHFMRSTQADLDQQKDKVIARALALTNRARTLWQEYRAGGAIDASLRIETSISARFRNQARLLSESRQAAQRGAEIYALIGVSGADPSMAIRDEIQTEARLQRNALIELRNVLDPALVRDKLALLGEQEAQ